MDSFEAAYKQLNGEQKQAVDIIDGPLLVIAGPGTGKTQLLSLRVANILQKTDVDPSNILCLTFTENGAANMRERMSRFIGQSAYNVNISTYHAFGGDLIQRFPEYFAEQGLENPIDELGKHQILRAIVESLSYTNPLKQTRHHLGDLITTISEVKRALLTPASLRAIAEENSRFITTASRQVSDIFASFSRMPSKVVIAQPLFEQTLQALQSATPEKPVSRRFGSLASLAIMEVQAAIAKAEDSGKTTPLTTWKNKWLAKNDDNNFVLAGELENQRIAALADVLEQYQEALRTRRLYDFDDMIVEAVRKLEKHPNLRYSLQEKYLYILLDEFQDTNAAQLKLVQLLTDNPVHEGRPNVMAVGDDDQAIYAFQGAQYSNMLDFYNLYRDVTVVSLTKNYRSHADILLTAENVATQIGHRLHEHFEGSSKQLVAANDNLPKTITISREEYVSDIAQYDALAHRIQQLIEQGTAPREIAVLAPKHKQLMPLVAYLTQLHIPVRYEKRENILEAPVVRQLLTMSRLVLALAKHDERAADALWPEVLSYEFWELPVSKIWQLSWQVSDDPLHKKTWCQVLCDDEASRPIALLFLALAQLSQTETAETMLDYLIGTQAVETREPGGPKTVCSLLRSFYTEPVVRETQPQIFYETVSHLAVLRSRWHDHQATSASSLTLADLLAFVDMYTAADEQMVNTSPYNQDVDAVQLMTVFKAKGLEFDYVFLPCCHDDVWGATARGNSNKLSLPANLQPIRHAGATDDERLRILYVALTRARIGLCLTSYRQNFSGTDTRRLKYLNEQEQAEGGFKALVLPEKSQTVVKQAHTAPAIELLELDWRQRHLDSLQDSNLHDLLADRLSKFQLSPTNLCNFTDVINGGPEQMLFSSLLRFPPAPTADMQFGNAIHETLEWLQHRVTQDSKLPVEKSTLEYFAARMQDKRLTPERTQLEIERGQRALKLYLAERGNTFKPTNRAEYNFRNEGVFITEAHLTGKVDRMEIDRANRTITVVDYKTGKSLSSWRSDAKLHKYRQQLYFYKLLIENSHTFHGYSVKNGRIEFIEAEGNQHIHILELTFDNKELEQLKKLIAAVWQHIMKLDFPDISGYQPTLSELRRFEQGLIGGTI